MNPQQPLPPNYLDQIAPQAQRHSFMMNKPRLYVFIGIIAVVLVIILSVTVGAISNAQKQPWERLSARLTATSAVANSSSSKIKNSQLRSTNSNVAISLTNTQRDITAPLTKLGLKADKISPSIVKEESSAAMLARLEDARLNAKYDSTYAREMGYQLSNLLTLLKQMYANSTSSSNKAFLEAAYNNFSPLQKSLAEFSASNE